MNITDREPPAASRPGRGTSRPLKIALVMLALIAGFYLLREHWSHIAGPWVYLLLLACPLMHLFHGHGTHGRGTRPTDHTKTD